MSFLFSQSRVCLALYLILIVLELRAQDSTVYYKASITAAGATAQTPFWQYANQYGSIPTNGNFGIVDAGIYKVYNPNNPRKFQWSAGVQGIASYGRSENVFLSDLYAAVKLGKVEILAGQKRMIAGLTDTTLTSGSLPMAGNARPYPRIQVAIEDYLPLYFTNNFVSLKFTYSDGYLGGGGINYGSAPYVQDIYLHQKQLYFRLGNKSHRYRIYLGGNHQAMWGSEDEIIPLYKLGMLKAYWYTISGKTLDYKKVGNHFGTFDIGGEWYGKNWKFFIYRQNIFETGSLFRTTNFEDGLNGISVKRLKPLPKGSSYFAFHSFILEVIGTRNQTNQYPISELALFKDANYYNSYLYRRGWSYYGSGMGTPLAPASANTNSELPRNKVEFTNNNRFWAFHTGATATWMHLKLAFRGTYSRNYGSYLTPFDRVRQQVSLSLNVEKNINILRGCSVYSALSSDIGDLYPTTYGLSVGLRKSGFLD